MTRPTTKKLLAGGLLAAAIAASAAGIASAQSSTTTPGTQTEEQSPAYTSSITTPDDGADNGKGDEASESATLQPLAKITPEQAKAAALAAVPGTAGKVELENENGNVVYGVEIADAAGKHTDVKVDAGNGTVLSQDADDEGSEENEANEANEADEANEQPDTVPTPAG